MMIYTIKHTNHAQNGQRIYCYGAMLMCLLLWRARHCYEHSKNCYTRVKLEVDDIVLNVSQLDFYRVYVHTSRKFRAKLITKNRNTGTNTKNLSIG